MYKVNQLSECEQEMLWKSLEKGVNPQKASKLG